MAPMYSDSVFQRVGAALSAFSGDGCWEWPKSRTVAGYGQLTYRSGGKSYLAYAHRAAYILHNGPIADGLHACHKCDNPGCFNPAHLFIGTPKDNMQDMAQKGRSKRGRKFPAGDKHWTKRHAFPLSGTRNGCAKITEQQAQEILDTRETAAQVARRLGVTYHIAWSIQRRKSWPHLIPTDQQARPRSHGNRKARN